MNNYEGEARIRGQNLLIVEGNHEKNELFWLIFKCFPEINIDMDDIWIYGTNIYQLYEDIVRQYDSGWAERGEDIDLPYVISKKQHPEKLRYKEDFTNIILVFDFERHDTNFSESKILEMQKYFVDAADMGKLYINYPMIESYQHLKSLPDEAFAERKIPVSLRPGKKYKALVNKETIIGKMVEFPHRIDDLLEKHLGVWNEEKRKKCCDAILNISDESNIDHEFQNILQEIIAADRLETTKYQLRDWIKRLGYIHMEQTYLECMRAVFIQIICHNICKANRIQNSQYHVETIGYRECFDNLDLTRILEIQNVSSRYDETGFIWVLNTCIFFVAEYNFSMITG